MDKYSRYKKIRNWEIGGFFFIIIFGSLLHFTYEWSGKNTIIGLLSPVNESVWEHLKMSFWSIVLYSLVEKRFIGKYVQNFWFGKGLGLFLYQLFIVLVFYAYTAVFGKELLWMDIAIFIVGAALSQWISFKLLTSHKIYRIWNKVGLLFILLHAVATLAFTFSPPKLPLFQDSHTKTYGIDKKAP